MRGYNEGPKAARALEFIERINDDSKLNGCLEALRYLPRSQDIIE